jgi:hypothetical protein
LIDQRTAWLQRLQAQLFHQGVPPGLKPRTTAGRRELATLALSPAGSEVVELCSISSIVNWRQSTVRYGRSPASNRVAAR